MKTTSRPPRSSQPARAAVLARPRGAHTGSAHSSPRLRPAAHPHRGRGAAAAPSGPRTRGPTGSRTSRREATNPREPPARPTCPRPRAAARRLGNRLPPTPHMIPPSQSQTEKGASRDIGVPFTPHRAGGQRPLEGGVEICSFPLFAGSQSLTSLHESLGSSSSFKKIIYCLNIRFCSLFPPRTAQKPPKNSAHCLLHALAHSPVAFRCTIRLFS